MGKLIIFSAPSGSGKSTIIQAVRQRETYPLQFSVSATNRLPREGEQNGVHYYFLTTDEFREHIDRGDFLEYEEVYPGRFYGTLKSEIDRRLDAGEDVVLDIDVNGGLNVKKIYGDRALALFIQPPSIDVLRERLEKRATESPETLAQRLDRASYELSLADRFDTVIVNDRLDEAVDATANAIGNFLAN